VLTGGTLGRAGVAVAGLAAALIWCAPAGAVTVTNTHDSGPGSLRATLTAAPAGETIVVPPGTYRLISGPIQAENEAVTLKGSGAGSTIIEGSGSARLIEMSKSLNITGVTLRNGTEVFASKAANAGGGAIYDNGAALTISASAFTGNTFSTGPEANGYDGGGAIYVQGGSAAISDTDFSANGASVEGGDQSGGGAIFLDGGAALALVGDHFSGDVYTQNGGGEFDGGGAVMDVNGPVTISGSTFAGEQVAMSATKSYFSYSGGGAVWAGAGVTVSDSTFSGDVVQLSFGLVQNGGGGLFSFGGPTTISGSTFSANTTNLGLLGLISNGGAGAYTDGETLAVLNSTFSGNTVNASGADNTAAGGGLYNYGSGGTITSTTIAGNSVSFPGFNDYAIGGGIYEFGESTSTSLSLRETILAGNTLSAEYAAGVNCSAEYSKTTITSAGNNLEDANSCGLTGPGDLINTNPLLAPLAVNGGPTQTQALQFGSPAIGAGGVCASTTDQRGAARATPCDIGAFESQPPLNTAAPALSGGSFAGQGLSCSSGSWSGDGPLAFSYQWLRDGTAISGAQSSGYRILSGDVGHGLSCQVTATGPAGHASALSAAVVGRGGVKDSPPRPPTISRVSESARRWRLGKHLPAVTAARKPPIGTTFTVVLSDGATIRLSFQRTVAGRRHGKRCVASTRKNRHAASCRRTVVVATVSEPGQAGLNKIRFQGRLKGGVTLKPGRYTVVITAVSAAGRKSAPKTLSFTVLPS
jgi:hypothetical protein